MRRALYRFWFFLRQLMDDDAYDRYLEHWKEHHGDEGAPMDRKQFYKAELERKWNGIRRCC